MWDLLLKLNPKLYYRLLGLDIKEINKAFSMRLEDSLSVDRCISPRRKFTVIQGGKS